MASESEQSCINDWKLLYELRRCLLSATFTDTEKVQLRRLHDIALQSTDAAFVQAILRLESDLTNNRARTLLEWYSSSVDGNIYPPIDINEESTEAMWPAIQNPSVSEQLRRIYTLRQPLVQTSPHRIIQQSKHLPDCSLVASLINIRHFAEQKLKLRRVTKDRYYMNLHFNGCNKRFASIDVSKIPTTAEAEQLCLESNNIEDKVIEYAYLSIFYNSYDYSGSNTAIDTFRLIGFLPEIVDVSQYSLGKLENFLKNNLCLIAVGTGKISCTSKPFISEHDYCVNEVSTATHTITLRDPLNSKLDLQISEDELHKYFTQLYLNWDPEQIFKNKISQTFHYNAEKCNPFLSVTDKPIFAISNNTKRTETVWLLLETHLSPEFLKKQKFPIAYLQQVPQNMLSTSLERPKGATNIGLHLSKVELDPGQKKELFCHTSSSSTLTVHLYSITQNIKITRVKKLEHCEEIQFQLASALRNPEGKYIQPLYYEFSAFSEENTIIPADFKIRSIDDAALLNLQIFRSDEKESVIQNPSTKMQYEAKIYTLRNVPIMTNHTYILAPSMQNNERNGELYTTTCKITALLHHTETELTPLMSFKPVSLHYGRYLHELEIDIQVRRKEDKTRVKLSSNLANKCFIRIIPSSKSLLPSLTCHILRDDGTELHDIKTIKFHSEELILDNILMDKPSSIILSINSKLSNDLPQDKTVPLTVLVGSERKLSYKII